MRLGLLVRADNRGLGIQSFEFWRHLSPAVTVCVDMGALSPYTQRFERYPGAIVARFDGGSLEPYEEALAALSGCDVVLTHETFYDYRLIEDLRRASVKTAVQANWEFFRWAKEPELPRPDLFLAPSPWYLERWPEGTVYLPTPVARDRLRHRPREKAETFLHVAGHRAMQDRNGTRLVLAAAKHLRSEARILIRSQSRLGVSIVGRNRCEILVGDIEDYAELYQGADVLVAPRRFGGQSLPMNEAMASGMPVISLGVPPQSLYLPEETLIPARRARAIRVQSGEIDWYDAKPQAIAAMIDRLYENPKLVSALSADAAGWAAHNSWEALLPRWRRVLDALARGIEVAPAR